jgi:hypothetical protein
MSEQQSVSQVSLAGVSIILAGQQYVLPPINAATHRLYADRLRAFEAGEEQDPLGLVACLVQAALRRNYPAIADNLADEYVDIDNANMLMSACMGQRSWRKWLELQAQSELQAGKTPVAMEDGTGAPSTPASPPPPDGLSLRSID